MFKWLFGRKQLEYRCTACGEMHEGSPSFSIQYPTYYYDVPEADRGFRVLATDDLCHIMPEKDVPEGEDIFCIRVILEIPIHGAKEPFTWGVWVSQSKDSFEKYVETFDQDQSSLGSFGWLPVTMVHYNRSQPGAPFEHLECDVQWGLKGQRPKIFLWESEHPLAIDQRDGISPQRAQEIADLAFPGFAHHDQIA